MWWWLYSILIATGCGRIGFDAEAGDAIDCTDPNSAQHCYTPFLDETVVWQVARTACASLGPTTHLVTINGAGENEVVARFAAMVAFNPNETNTNQRQLLWVGGTDLGSVGTWRWITGEPFGFMNWRAGEPSNPGVEDCLIVLGAQNGLWDNRSCEDQGDRYAFLCERE